MKQEDTSTTMHTNTQDNNDEAGKDVGTTAPPPQADSPAVGPSSSTILQDEKSQIAYPKGKKNRGTQDKPANQDDKKEEDPGKLPQSPPREQEQLVSSLLLEEKQNITYPACKQGARSNLTPQEKEEKKDADAAPNQRPRIHDSEQANTMMTQPQLSALLMEEKGNIIYPACKQQQQLGKDDGVAANNGMVDQEVPSQGGAAKCWADKEAKRPHPPQSTEPMGRAADTNELLARAHKESQQDSMFFVVPSDGAAIDVEDDFSIDLTESHLTNAAIASTYGSHQPATHHGQEGNEESNNNDEQLQ
jgi:hypothetical protein